VPVEPPYEGAPVTDIERRYVALRAAEMAAADQALSLSDAEEEAVAEWDRGVVGAASGAAEALREFAATDRGAAAIESLREFARGTAGPPHICSCAECAPVLTMRCRSEAAILQIERVLVDHGVAITYPLADAVLEVLAQNERLRRSASDPEDGT
jgi:hypothetical protein